MATSSAWTRAIWPCAVLRDSCKTNPRPTSPWGGTRADRFTHRPQRHSPPGDAGTARRGMKTVESSAMFQPKSWRKKKPDDIGNRSKPDLCPIRRENRTSFETPMWPKFMWPKLGGPPAWRFGAACLCCLKSRQPRELFDPAAFGASLSLKSQPRGEVDGSRKPQR